MPTSASCWLSLAPCSKYSHVGWKEVDFVTSCAQRLSKKWDWISWHKDYSELPGMSVAPKDHLTSEDTGVHNFQSSTLLVSVHPTKGPWRKLLAQRLLNFLEKSSNGYFMFLTYLGLEQAREPKGVWGEASWWQLSIALLVFLRMTNQLEHRYDESGNKTLVKPLWLSRGKKEVRLLDWKCTNTHMHNDIS